jgi:hypothetical protein
MKGCIIYTWKMVDTKIVVKLLIGPRGLKQVNVFVHLVYTNVTNYMVENTCKTYTVTILKLDLFGIQMVWNSNAIAIPKQDIFVWFSNGSRLDRSTEQTI